MLDTNVLVSALLSPHGAPAQLLKLIVSGEIALLLDDRLLLEYRDVAHRPRFGFRAEDVDRLIAVVAAAGEHVLPPPLKVRLPDPDDLAVLEVAVAGRADALVTGNVRHFLPVAGRHEMVVRTPRQVLDSLRR